MLLCVWILATPYGFAAEPATAPETQNEKESYSIGYQVGMSMKADGVEVDFDRLIQGLQDAVDENEPRLSHGGDERPYRGSQEKGPCGPDEKI